MNGDVFSNVNWTENINIIRNRLYYKSKEHRKYCHKLLFNAQRHMVFEINIYLPKCYYSNILELYNIINAHLFT